MRKIQNQRKRKKTVKGMTLIECIISILVVGVAGTIMAVAVTCACNYLRNANHVNNKTHAESPVAAVQDAAALTDTGTEIKITVESGTFKKEIDAKSYSTKELGDAASNANTAGHLDSDLTFYVID